MTIKKIAGIVDKFFNEREDWVIHCVESQDYDGIVESLLQYEQKYSLLDNCEGNFILYWIYAVKILRECGLDQDLLIEEVRKDYSAHGHRFIDMKHLYDYLDDYFNTPGFHETFRKHFPEDVFTMATLPKVSILRNIHSTEDLGHRWVDDGHFTDDELIEYYLDYDKVGQEIDETGPYANEEGELQSAGLAFCGDENASYQDIGRAVIAEYGFGDLHIPLLSVVDYDRIGRDNLVINSEDIEYDLNNGIVIQFFD